MLNRSLIGSPEVYLAHLKQKKSVPKKPKSIAKKRLSNTSFKEIVKIKSSHNCGTSNMSASRTLGSRTQSTFFLHNAEKAGSKEVKCINEDLNEESESKSSRSRSRELDPKNIRLT